MWCTKASMLGRPAKISKEHKIIIQEYWKRDTVSSVDRRNLRNCVQKIFKNINKIARNVLDQDKLVIVVTTKRGIKYRAERCKYETLY